MGRIFKYITVFFAIIVALLAIVVATLNFMPGDKLKGFISSGVQSATGRSLEIQGDLDIELTSIFAVRVSGIKFANVDWGSRAEMATIDNFELEVALLPLLKGILDVSLLVDKPDLLLETSSTGQGNWLLKEAKKEEKIVEKEQSGDAGLPLELRVRKIAITGTRVVYKDGKNGDQVIIEDEELLIEPGNDKVTLDLAGHFNEIPLGLSAIFNKGAFFIDNSVTPITVNAHLGTVELAPERPAGQICPGFELDVNANLSIDTLAALSPLTGQNIPDIGPLTVSAQLIGRKGSFSLQDAAINLNDEIVQVTGTGGIGDLIALRDLNLKADVSTKHLTKVLQMMGVQLDYPLPDTFKASAAVSLSGKEISSLVVKAQLPEKDIKAEVSGSIADMTKLTGIKVGVKLSIPSLATVGGLVKQQLPDSGPLSLSGDLVAKGGIQAPLHVNLSLAGDGVKAGVKGSIDQPLAGQGINLMLSIEADSLEKVGALTGTKLIATKPLKLAGRFTADEEKYHLAELHLSIAKFEAEGEAAYHFAVTPDKRPMISAILHVGDLDLRQRQESNQKEIEKKKAEAKEAGAGESGKEKEDKESGQEKNERIFPSEPLPWKTLRTLDADIKITVDSLKTLQLNLEDVDFGLGLKNGLLSLHPIQAKIGAGTLAGNAMLDARQSPAILMADIRLTDATFRDFGGRINSLIDLEGSGDSIAEIMAGLDGQVEFDVRDATLKTSAMTKFGTSVFSSINPFAKDEEETELKCAIVFFDIEDGIADARRRIGAQMTDVTWFGNGTVNLITEEIKFGMSPKTRKGIGSMGGLAKLAHLNGTLANPKINLSQKDMAIKYGKYSAALATGGITLLADMLISRIRANKDMCTVILEDLEEIQEKDRQTRGKEVESLEDGRTMTREERKTEKKKKAKARKAKRNALLMESERYL